MTCDPVTGPVTGQPVMATAEGVAAAVALLVAEMQGSGALLQESIIEDVTSPVVLRSLVVLAAAVLRAVTDDEGAAVLRSIGEGAVEITVRREPCRCPDTTE
jgi:hypothetical protein